MTKMELPKNFAEEIAVVLGFDVAKVEELFEIGEDKQGWFYAKKKPKVWLDKVQFKALCSLCREYGGRYVSSRYAWVIPGPYAKKETSLPASMPNEPTGVTPQVVSMDTAKPTYITVPINALLSMPFQSRSTEDPELAELIESIKIYGVLEPILVRPKPSGLYEIVAGERRVRAAKKAGLTEVPVIIKWLTDQEAYEVQLIENIQRKDLADIEKARMLDYMIKKFGYLQKDLAKKLGKSEGWISRHLQMLEIEKLAPGQVEVGELTERQARAILAAPEEKREEILNQIAETGEVPSSREIYHFAQPTAEGSFTEETTAAPPSVPTEATTGGSAEVGPVEIKPEREPEPLLTAMEWECPECHHVLVIQHSEHPDGRVSHKILIDREGPQKQ